MTTIYVLTCEDASHLGGPMGSEYTTHLWSQPYSSEEEAKFVARKYDGSDAARWQQHAPGFISWDSGGYIFTIREQTVDAPPPPRRRGR